MLKFLLIFLMPIAAFSAELNLVKITNDEDREIAHMIIDIDDRNEIMALHHRRYLNGKLIKSEEFPAELSYEGRVLVKMRGKKVVILRGLNIDSVNGGSLEIDFLYNGITGSRNKFTVSLEKDEDGNWALVANGKKVEHLHCVSNKKRFVGTVGIRRIVVKK